MKQMQDFRKWLSSTDETPASHRRSLAALTGLDREHILRLGNDLGWFVWSAGKPAASR